MKSAPELAQIACAAAQTKLLQQNGPLLLDIEAKLEAAASKGETEIYDIFINHKVKYKIVDYLKSLGYQCFEAKLGNTFTISCDPSFKK